MKIAILGKGGSGKSSLSWLLVNYLASDMKYKTLAIDGDHNMDLTSNLGVDETKLIYFKEFNSDFRKLSNMPDKGMWKVYFDCKPIEFNYPYDTKLKRFIYPVSTNLDLMVVGLGDQDLMNYNVCSHGVSAPLKYMLPTLKMENNSALVYDSVAGVDMLIYGLYFGFDVLLIVVEGHSNSIKVAKQIQSLAKLQNLPVKFCINKFSQSNEMLKQFMIEFKDEIIAQLPNDNGILQFDYNSIQESTKESLHSMIKDIPINSTSSFELYNRLKTFEFQKK